MAAVMVGALAIGPHGCADLRAESAGSWAGSAGDVFYQYAVPLDPSIASVRVETDKTRDRPALALRLHGRSSSGNLRGDFSIARGVVASSAAEALNASREMPSSLDLAYDVLRDQEAGEHNRVTVTVQGHRQEKTIRDIEGSAAVNLVLALFPSLESGPQSSPWSAKVGVGLQRLRQLIAQGTGSEGGNGRREISTTLHTVGAQWSQQWLTVDYRLAFGGQDTVGGGRPDPSTLQTLLASLQPDPRFTLRGGVASGRLGPGRDARYASLGFDWQVRPGLTLSSGCDVELGSGPVKSTKHGCAISGGLTKALEFLGPVRAPIDLYALPSFGTTRFRSGGTDLASNDWRLDAGFSIRF
jgi:hypothetical protein